MQDLDRKSHWEGIYTAKDEREVSWFEESPALSLDLIAATGAPHASAVIDIGGGAAHLADALLDGGYSDVTVLDLAESALTKTKARLGARASQINWIVDDVTSWEPKRQYDVWHDRAVFHFLTEPGGRTAYGERLIQGVKSGGHVIIGTFAFDGPDRCSGLPVQRYDAASLASVLPAAFALVSAREEAHRTPSGAIQRFQFSTFSRRS